MLVQFRQLLSLALVGVALSQDSTSSPGYDSNIPSTVTNSSFSFGHHYAVLNLDMINGLVASVENSNAGKNWIQNTAKWIDAVHQQSPPPLSIFTRIYFSTSQRPEVGPNTPFLAVVEPFGNVTANDAITDIYHAFKPLRNWDVVLQKVRYYAGAGNALEEILSSQGIDTVILSGIRTSGVILSTAMRLFDLNYNVYVIANNTIETAPDTPEINTAILEGILPKMPVNVITIEQALSALKRSGPAVDSRTEN